MTTTEGPDGRSLCVRVPDFQAGTGWGDGVASARRARWCCEQLEQGRILFFEKPPFGLTSADRRFLLSHRVLSSRRYRDISYAPDKDALRGFALDDVVTRKRLLELMRHYAREVTRFTGQLLQPYADDWTVEQTTFLAQPESDRKLPVRKRDDLMHVDALPARPTHGGRILSCFTNLDPSHPRVWQTTEAFPELARHYAQDAGLAQIAELGIPPLETFTRMLRHSLGLEVGIHSAYDKFMLRFQDYLKGNAAFQRDCPKSRLDFPPGSTWLCFTDAMPHAVIFGQYALEQTVIVPLSAMVMPEKSPLHILELLADGPLVTERLYPAPVSM